MRICLIGGIFGKPASYRQVVTSAPETVLAAGLRERGHHVTTVGQRGPPPDLTGFEIVHAHHLAAGTVQAAAHRMATSFVFTSHWFEQVSLTRRLAQRYVLARADASVVLSRTEADWQRRCFPGVAAKQHIIPNGVDAATFCYVPPPSPPRRGVPWRLLFVGQLSRFKGVHYLLEALSSLQSEFPVVLQMAYHVDTEKAALEAQAAAWGLTGLRFLGPQSPQQLARLYADSHLLVLPSTGEAMPLVISEALLVGRPVVGTDVGAVKEQVADFGRVVAPHDSSALANAIREVCLSYASFATRAGEASGEARAHYSIESMVEAHERLYVSLREAGCLRSRGDQLLDWPRRRVTWTVHRLRSVSIGSGAAAGSLGAQQPRADQR
jgi:glycosyltransferase involved in cell wall biosynthesis